MATFNTTGTITVTNGSAAVTGSGSNWLTAGISGGTLYVAGAAYPILSINSNTSLTLAINIAGTSGGGKTYAIAVDQALLDQTTANANRLAVLLDDLSPLSGFTTFSTDLMANSSQSTWRTGLGLGTAATVNTGTAGATIPLLNGNNTHSGTVTFSKDLGINGLTFGRGGSDLSTNTAVGLAALPVANAGFNVAIGAYTLGAYGSASSVAVGYAAGSKTTANAITAIGSTAARYHTGSGLTALGTNALRGVDGSSTGNNNTAVGSSAGLNVTTGYSNTLVGMNSGINVTSGNNNTLLGINAGSNLSSGSFNILIGQNLTASSATVFNELNIGGAIKGNLSTGLITVPTAGINIGDETVSTGTLALQLGHGRTGNGYSIIDLVGDATYSDYGMRMVRGNGGANTNSEIQHRGTGSLMLSTIDAGAFVVRTNSVSRLTVGTTGNAQLSAYGAGTLVSDASGNITASSDERLKTSIVDFARGLAAINAISPKSYNWNAASGFDQMSQYSGFIAQDIEAAIPEAVGVGSDGFLTLQDRPIIAALVNAVKELTTLNEALAARVAALEVA